MGRRALAPSYPRITTCILMTEPGQRTDRRPLPEPARKLPDCSRTWRELHEAECARWNFTILPVWDMSLEDDLLCCGVRDAIGY